jgi:hypothetical protein
MLSGHHGELVLFHSQHRRVCDLLVRSKAMASLLARLKKALPYPSPEIEHARTWLEFAPPEVGRLRANEQDWWPISINIIRRANGKESPKYSVRLMWNRDRFDEALCDERALLDRFQQNFVGLSRFTSANVRRLLIAKGLDEEAAVAKAVWLDRKVSELLVDGGLPAT